MKLLRGFVVIIIIKQKQSKTHKNYMMVKNEIFVCMFVSVGVEQRLNEIV